MNSEERAEIRARLDSANGIALDEVVARWYRTDVAALLDALDEALRGQANYARLLREQVACCNEGDCGGADPAPQSEAPAPQPSGLVERVEQAMTDPGTPAGLTSAAHRAALAVADWLDDHFALPGAAGCIRREVEGVERS